MFGVASSAFFFFFPEAKAPMGEASASTSTIDSASILRLRGIESFRITSIALLLIQPLLRGRCLPHVQSVLVALIAEGEVIGLIFDQQPGLRRGVGLVAGE